jgi:thermitase
VITSSDNCQAVAAGVDASEQRAEVSQTLPNGRPYPNHEPRNVNIPNRPVRDQVLIQFTPDSSQQQRNDYVRSINGRSRRNIDRLNTYVVTIPPGTDTTALPESPIVTLIEPDYVAGASQSPPSDPRYGEQWGLPMIGLTDPWGQLPAGSPFVIVAVIDSGICANHPDLQGRILSGFDFVDDDNDPTDTFGHGCGVAGVIAASANNSIGIAGVAPNAAIMPLRVLDSNGLGNYSDIAAAIVYAADNGVQIINLSLGGTYYSQVLADAVNYAAAKGVTLIAAAGNYGQEGAFFPGAFAAVIAVGSVDVDLQRSSFSNYGDDVPIYAPGRDILTTSMNGDYELVSGTSFAAPIVSGIAAMSRAFGLPLNTENGIVYLYAPSNQPGCQ